MDDWRSLVFEFVAAAVVCTGAVVLGPAFDAHPSLTVLGSLTFALLVGVVLFVHLDRRADPPMARWWTACLAVMILGVAAVFGLLIWVFYCGCVIA